MSLRKFDGLSIGDKKRLWKKVLQNDGSKSVDDMSKGLETQALSQLCEHKRNKLIKASQDLGIIID